jgi:hypothetical protein
LIDVPTADLFVFMISQDGMEQAPLLDVLEKIEDLLFKKALRENHPVPHGTAC